MTVSRVSFWRGSERINLGAYLERSFVDHDLVETSLDQSTAQMLKLLASLNQQVSSFRRELNSNTLPTVTSPNVESGVARAAMDCEKVEVGVESCENGIFLAILHEI